MPSPEIRKHFARIALQFLAEVVPGTKEYCAASKGLMPIEVSLGQEFDAPFLPVTWRPSEENNGFFLILGASGSGKTETLKLIGNQLIEHGVPVLVIDFHGDIDIPWMQPTLMSSGYDSVVGVNPMELDSHRAYKVGLYDQRMALIEMISRAVPDISHNQKVMLTEAMEAAYRWVGIYDDDPDSWGRSAPTFATVIGILEEWLSDDSMKRRRPTISGCLSAIKAVFGHPIFDRDLNLSVGDILSLGAHVDLSRVPDGIRYIVADTLLRKVFRTLTLQGHIPVNPQDDTERFRLFIIVDEAKILSKSKGSPNASDLILNILATEGRKFGIGLILASQMSDHFSDELKASVSARLVMKPLDMAQAKKNAPDVHVLPEDLIGLMGMGDCYFRSQCSEGTKRLKIQRCPAEF